VHINPNDADFEVLRERMAQRKALRKMASSSKLHTAKIMSHKINSLFYQLSLAGCICYKCVSFLGKCSKSEASEAQKQTDVNSSCAAFNSSHASTSSSVCIVTSKRKEDNSNNNEYLHNIKKSKKLKNAQTPQKRY